MESIVSEWLLEIVGPQIGSDQFWGLKGSSTTHALVDMLHHWHLHTDRMNISGVFLLDYSKAFELVDHILVNRLYSYDVPDILVLWIGSFLSEWRQHVWIDQELSDWLHVNGSVLQGPWLGPLLFVIMINDLQARGLLHKYMDDSTVTEEVSHPADSHLQENTDNTVQWSDDNHMMINGKKTKEIVTSFKKSTPFIPPLKINGLDIDRVTISKRIGIYLSGEH